MIDNKVATHWKKRVALPLAENLALKMQIERAQ